MGKDAEAGAALDLQRIIDVLDRHRVDYIVVGGVAARLHGARRLAMDVDVCPAWQDDNLGRLAEAYELGAVLQGLPPSVTLPPISGAMLRSMDVGSWRSPAGDIDVLQGTPLMSVGG